MKKLFALLLAVLLLGGCASTYDGPVVGVYVLTEETQTHYSMFGQPQYTERTTYAYDIQGNLVREMEYWNEDLENAFHYRYDDRGSLISMRHWDHSKLIPLPRSTTKYTYDDLGRVLTTVVSNGWGLKTHSSTYTYDDETHSYTCDNGSGEPDTYFLDENGKTIRSLCHLLGSLYEYRYERDAWGHVIRSWTYENGTLHSSYEARYDDRGRLLWEGDYDGAGRLERETSIEYDDEAHTMTTHYSGSVLYSYYDPDGRILHSESYDLAGELLSTREYTYQMIQVSAKEGTP